QALDKIEDAFINNELDYGRKLFLIENCIYGVDIQPVAVQIAKLRFFISLIIDQKTQPAKENLGIQSLPNLETKFVAANTLIDLEKPDVQGTLRNPEIVKLENELKDLRHQYFNARTRNEKLKYQRKDKKLRQEIAGLLVNDGWDNRVAQQIVDFNPYDQNKFAPFFDSEWMFGVKDGFDIVIGNPPYIGESGNKEIFRNIAQNTFGKKYYVGKMDYYYFFFHKAIDITNQMATITYITTNYYPTATGAKKLREDFKKRTSILKLINFNELRVFESALGQHNMITILSRKNNPMTLAKISITKRQGESTPTILTNIFQGTDECSDYYSVLQTDLYEGNESYIRMEGGFSTTSDDPVQSVLNKIINRGIVLKKVCLINQGIVSGCDYIASRNIDKLTKPYDVLLNDGIFVFDLTNKRDFEVLKSFTNEEKQLLKPFFKNSDIESYWCKLDPDKYILYLDRNSTTIDCYPNIRKHLDKYIDILTERREVENGIIEYFQLQWPRVKNIFMGEKIVVPYRCKKNHFAYNDVEWFCRSDCYVISQKDPSIKLKYLLALLNSKLYYLWFYFKGKRKGEMLELFQTPLSEAYIAAISAREQMQFVKLVDKILNLTTAKDYLENKEKQTIIANYREEIDQVVYKLYDLTPVEIKMVENFYYQDRE
ncbi:MAG: Eco57I restriction-modification methylase domain-containing protein, partial [Methanocorpusculum sp.]|nr:Eco57I restriction-modification methylase domain-containing protein [Methanocorpusculum sp.]